jgi:hypothetical protein
MYLYYVLDQKQYLSLIQDNINNLALLGTRSKGQNTRGNEKRSGNGVFL